MHVILPSGHRMVIDDADAWVLELGKWRVHLRRDRRGVSAVVCGTPCNGTLKLLHRVLLDAPDGTLVDHRNCDALDNRRANLRLCTVAENCRNRGPAKSNKCGLKGVYRDKVAAQRGRDSTWRAQIRVDGRKIRLGYFRTAEEAGAAYASAAAKYHGEFARCA